MKIYCCHCGEDIQAKLVDGRTVYPHRPDLHDLPFWECPVCNGYVGCHYKTKNRTRPLGCIPTDYMRTKRREIHAIIDTIWKQKILTRSEVYRRMSEKLGWDFHSGATKSDEDCDRAFRAAEELDYEVFIMGCDK